MAGNVIQLTDAGRAALVAPGNTGTAARKITQIGLGTASFVFKPDMKVLPNELKRTTTFGASNVASDTMHVMIQDDTNAQYKLYAFGLYLDNGVLLGVYVQDTPILEKAPAAMLLLAAEAGLPMPAGAYLLSPWLDLGPRTPHPGYALAKDPLLAPDAIRAWGKAYRGDEHPSHPKISPVLADLKYFPRTLIQVGGAEALLEDSLAFTRKLALAGTDVQLNVWKDQVHAWPLFHADMPLSGGAAIAQAGEWMDRVSNSDAPASKF